MAMQFEFTPNADRTDPADMSRPWGRLTAKINAGMSDVELSLWPDGAHILKVAARGTNIGAVVTASRLAELARIVQSVAELCADRDVTHSHVIEEIAAQLPPVRVAYEREEDGAAAALAALSGPVFPGAGEPFADWDQA